MKGSVVGLAFSWSPREWRWGWCDAIDDQIVPGRHVVVGRWLCFGPVAITFDYE